MEEERISNQRYRIAFMRGFTRGCSGTVMCYGDYKDVHYSTSIEAIRNQVEAAYKEGYEYGYTQRSKAHSITYNKYPRE